LLIPALFLLLSLSPLAIGQTYDWVGTDGNWNNPNNWITGTEPPVEYGVPPMNQDTLLSFAAWPGVAVSLNNNLGNWRDVGRISFDSSAPSFTLNGDAIGFRPFQGTGNQVISQFSPNTQTINFGAMSFRPDVDSELVLWGGDLVIDTPNLYIDMSADAWRTLYIKGSGDGTRRTVTFAGNVNRGGTGRDPDIVIQDNKRALVTGALNTGQGTDASVFIENGVLQFSGSGTMNGGAPLLGASSGSASAAILLDTAGTTLTNQIEVRGGSSGRRTMGVLNTSGTATFSGNIVENNSPGDLDLAAATGGTANFSGSRNLNAGLRINRTDGGTSYGGTVQLSGATTSTSWTALYNGALQLSNFSQLGSSHFEFDASSGDSGTLLYTGGTATTTKTLWIDNAGITRAAINVSNADTTLTWNPGDGNRNQNLTKTGAGALVFGSAISGGTVRVEAGKLVLGGTNTYSGGTTVAGGTLAINGDNSAATGAVAVANGATLAGSGTVGGQVVVSLGGKLSPGNSPGVLTATNGLSLGTGSTFEWEIIGNTASGRGTTFDGVNVTGGTLSIGTGVASSLVFNAGGSAVSWADSFWDSDQSWLVFDNANLPTLSSGSIFDTITLSADINAISLATLRPNASFSWNQQGNDVYLNYSAVPEPSTYALLALAAFGVGAHAWRRRQRKGS